MEMDFIKKNVIVNRAAIQNNYVSDVHIHFRGFGNQSLSFMEVAGFMIKKSILFGIITGIGQRLPLDTKCVYYGKCPGEKVTPSIINDIINLNNLYKHNDDIKDKLHLILSYTSLDLHKPEKSYDMMKLLFDQYPIYRSVGEINLCKQALFKHKRFNLPINKIPKLGKIMKLLRERKIPILIHCDLGNNKDNTKYLKLITKK